MNTGGDEAQRKQVSTQLVPHFLGQEGMKWQQLLVVKGMSFPSLGKGGRFLCLCVLHREVKERHETLLFFRGYVPREYVLSGKKQWNRIWNKSVNNSE